MSDQRRPRRPNNRRDWDEPERVDRRDRDYDRNRDRRSYRSRSRDRRGPGRDRSRSPEGRNPNRDDRRHQRPRDRDGPQRHHDRDRRRDDYDNRDRRDHARSPRRSQSPSASHNDLPTRAHPKHRRPDDNRRSPDRRPRDDQPGLNDEAEYHSRKRDQDDSKSRDDGDEMVEDGEEEEVDDDMAAMQAMMGFGSFNSTKGKKVAGNNAGGVRKEKKSEYRQYMNRQGGFNRPLSPSR